jgi:hypothetical protein
VYSPKINEELIPTLYRIAQQQHVPMTQLVDDLLRESLARYAPNTPGETAHEDRLPELSESDAPRVPTPVCVS